MNLSHGSTVSSNSISNLTDFSLKSADPENLQWTAIALSDERFGMIELLLFAQDLIVELNVMLVYLYSSERIQ